MKLRLLPALLFATATSAFAAVPPLEDEPVLPAASLLPAEILAAGGDGIGPEAPVEGFLGRFELRTEFGIFYCHGAEMLALRIQEAQALREIEKLSRTKLFTDAAKNAVVQPLQSAVKIVQDPVGAVKAVPKGVGRLFNSVAKGVQAVGRTADHALKGTLDTGDDGRPAKRGDIFGFNKARNGWAAKFGVDPYTSNSALAPKLTDLASMSFSTETIAGFGLGQVAAPLSMIGTVDELVLTKPPAEVRDINRARLLKLTGSRERTSAFLANRWFTPTLQTRYMNALGQLAGVRNLGAALAAAAQADSEDEVRFLCRVVESLASVHAAAPLAELRLVGRIPAGRSADGGVVVAAPVDAISWTETAARFSARLGAGAKVRLVTAAKLSEAARRELAARGWDLPVGER